MKNPSNPNKYGILRKALLSLTLFNLIWTTHSYALEKDAFFYLLDGQFLGGYSKVNGKSGDLSTSDSWDISPNVKIIKDVLYWINVYSGSYDRTSQVTSQEEGGLRTESTQSHNLTTALKYYINKNWYLRPTFFTDWSFVNETKDESFGNGLYDYRDIGGGIESTWILEASKAVSRQVIAGFRYYDRHYPNYVSLLSQFDPRAQVTEEHEKDFAGYESTLSYDSKDFTGWSWGAEGILLYKDFSDKRTIDENGIRAADSYRQDYLTNINLYVGHPITDTVQWRLDGQFAVNTSNLDFYDTHNTTSLTDDTFVRSYYDYFSFNVKPSLIYQKEIAKGKTILASVSYSFLAQHYPGRKTQDPAGIYQDQKEQDYTHTFSAEFRYPLTQYVSWVTVGNYTIADSNQKYEAFYLYSYDEWNVLTGFSFKY